jgi:hypothetical protein
MMAWRASTALGDDDSRLKQTMTYELHLERKLASPANEATSGENALVPPETIPADDETNSWVLYEDYPLKRFHFRHPQELQVNPIGLNDPNYIDLVERQPKGDVRLGIHVQPKETDPVRDRQSRDPEYHRRTLYSIWAKEKKDVLRGSSDWLTGPDWDRLKRRVYRIEAALRPKDQDPTNAERLYLDYYLVVFATNESVILTAMTEQDSSLKLREESEALIKSFEFDRPESSRKAPASPAAPRLSPPR